ncbi:hypothetical protein GO496_20350 [Acidovorax citrulli]|nr:hypothetical protein [Paracidovorax citrulli]
MVPVEPSVVVPVPAPMPPELVPVPPMLPVPPVLPEPMLPASDAAGAVVGAGVLEGVVFTLLSLLRSQADRASTEARAIGAATSQRRDAESAVFLVIDSFSVLETRRRHATGRSILGSASPAQSRIGLTTQLLTVSQPCSLRGPANRP